MTDSSAETAQVCCCQPYDPEANLVVRCLPRAMDMGHCRSEDFGQEFCCGGSDEAKVAAIVAMRFPPVGGRS